MIQQSAPAASAISATTGEGPAALPRVALVGVHGFGESHLANLARLGKAGVLELVAVADPNPPEKGALAGSVAVFNTLDQLLAAGPVPAVVGMAITGAMRPSSDAGWDGPRNRPSSSWFSTRQPRRTRLAGHP